ncbi:hypothetical protein [Burkholderia sp. AU6039]|uniref:hypothetical protein n=1 Tax=Burkholderia sp. AU6039 TaxID=2015344 RepID=UPI00117F3149|nr:hypothetical protein [Burkholderia sp. AU6039]
MRKIIQLSMTTTGNGPRDAEQELVIAALCDDGSAWLIRPDDGDSRWESLPEIPQGELLQNWLAEVGKCLTRNHLMRHDAIKGALKDNNKILVDMFESDVDAVAAASELNQRYQ